MVDVLDRAVASNPDGAAVVCEPVRLSYRELAAEVECLAAGLAELGVRRGDRVALWMVNRPEWVVTYFAVAKLGAVLVAVNTRYRTAECLHILQTSEANVVILQDEFRSQRYLESLQELCPDIRAADPGRWSSAQLPALREVIVVGAIRPRGARSFTDVVETGRGALASGRSPAAGVRGPDDTFLLLFTSGTTSRSKGVMLTHRNILLNSYHSGERQRLGPGDRMLVVLPLCSAFSCAHALLAIMTHQGAVVLLDAFSAADCMRLIQRERCTSMYAVDAIFREILDVPDRQRYDLSSLRTGVGVLTADVAEAIRDVLGVREYHQGWGMTECGGVVTVTSSSDPEWARMQTVGTPVPGLELAIVDPDSGQELDAGSVGEILVRGYAVTHGYYNDPAATAASREGAGWFHTGDLGELHPGGYLRFRGRIKEMFKPGGFNVSPLEVEEFLCSLPGVRSAAVIGVPDERMTEAGYAYVVRDDTGSLLTEEDIRRSCAEKLANFKVPKYVEFVDPDLPRNALGKVLKPELRETALRRLAAVEHGHR